MRHHVLMRRPPKVSMFPVLVAGAVLVAGCGGDAGDTGGGAGPGGDTGGSGEVPSAAPTPHPDAAVTTRSPATVLDDGDGAELCLGAIAESYPPQCGGPRLADWDWAAHEGEYEEAAGVRWGEFVVVGTYDGEEFTVEEVTPAGEWDGEPPENGTDLSTPCAEPDGGWQVRDPALTTDETLQEVLAVAADLDGYAGSWLDQSINPAHGSDDPDEVEAAMNDPRQLVVNVLVTGETGAAEEQLREVWGGALCVLEAEHSHADLEAAQQQLSEIEGYQSAGISVAENHVGLSVIYDDGTLQQQLDDALGEGVVEVSSALVPAR